MRPAVVLVATITIVVLSCTAPRAVAQEGPAHDVTLDTIVLDRTLVVTAGSTSSLRIAPTPGRGAGPTIECTWFSLDIDAVTLTLVQETNLTVDRAYLLWCWRLGDGGERTSLPGHPVVRTYTGPGIPGDPADVDDVSEFALDALEVAAPDVAISPAGRQLVGVETWLGVASDLDYDAIHAHAGPVWVSVRPEPMSVTWDMGDGDHVTCPVTDAVAIETWSAATPPRCAHVYERSADDATLTGTVTWQVRRRTFLEPEWQDWRELAISTSVAIAIGELQTVTF